MARSISRRTARSGSAGGGPDPRGSETRRAVARFRRGSRSTENRHSPRATSTWAPRAASPTRSTTCLLPGIPGQNGSRSSRGPPSSRAVRAGDDVSSKAEDSREAVGPVAEPEKGKGSDQDADGQLPIPRPEKAGEQHRTAALWTPLGIAGNPQSARRTRDGSHVGLYLWLELLMFDDAASW